ncbi:ERF family protein [Vagococcus vulneris]|uniref:Single-stranded DNA-binding protein n=1 Tax=Vagococcus vulneris TaxID=1977869 RepID=A0A429ZTL9_9ENTE|nr:ERF family protein [Vagococcus vulneris]RST96970.1 hypothetical protein CBF37_10470 [Vagococcus vulneris]
MKSDDLKKVETTYQKVMEVKKAVPYIQKQEKQSIRFRVVTSEDVLTAIQPVMLEKGLILEPHILNKEVTRQVIGTNTGGKFDKAIFSYLIVLDMEYVWKNVENPEDKISVKFVATAADENASYALGQALTYAEKTFILKYFNIPTDDSDPDIFQQQLLKKIPIDDIQVEGLHILVEKLKPYANQPVEAIAKQAKLTAKMSDIEKPFEKFSAYDFGVVANVMNGWLITYEKNAAKAEKAKKKA